MLSNFRGKCCEKPSLLILTSTSSIFHPVWDWESIEKAAGTIIKDGIKWVMCCRAWTGTDRCNHLWSSIGIWTLMPKQCSIEWSWPNLLCYLNCLLEGNIWCGIKDCVCVVCVTDSSMDGIWICCSREWGSFVGLPNFVTNTTATNMNH